MMKFFSGQPARSKAVFRSCLFGLGLTLATAGLAWACTPQPQIIILPRVGPPGALVNVEGSAFAPDAPVEIRWNRADGSKLADTRADPGGQFSVDVRVPADASGVSMVLAMTGGAEIARMPFDVAGRPPAITRNDDAGASNVSSTDLWKGFSPDGNRETPFGRPGAQTDLTAFGSAGVSSRAGLALGAAFLVLGLTALALSLKTASAAKRGTGESRQADGAEGSPGGPGT